MMQVWVRTYDQGGGVKGYLNFEHMDVVTVEKVGHKYRLVAKAGYVPTPEGTWSWCTNEYIWPEGFDHKADALEMLDRFVRDTLGGENE